MISLLEPNSRFPNSHLRVSWLPKNLDRLKGTAGQPLQTESDEIANPDRECLWRRPCWRAHVLSTREWLKTLEHLGLIGSARSVLDRIQTAERDVSRYLADRPTLPDRGTKSDWKDRTAETVAALLDDDLEEPGGVPSGSGR